MCLDQFFQTFGKKGPGKRLRRKARCLTPTSITLSCRRKRTTKRKRISSPRSCKMEYLYKGQGHSLRHRKGIQLTSMKTFLAREVYVSCLKSSESTLAPPTAAWLSWRAANPPLSQTPKAPGPHRPLWPSPKPGALGWPDRKAPGHHQPGPHHRIHQARYGHRQKGDHRR